MAQNNNLLLGLGMLGAAYYMMRTGAMNQQYRNSPNMQRRPLGQGSMPASVGSGVRQIAGGLIGNLLSPKVGGGTSTGAPPPLATPPYVGDYTINNDVWSGDPNMNFDANTDGMITTDSLGSLTDDLGSMYA